MRKQRTRQHFIEAFGMNHIEYRVLSAGCNILDNLKINNMEIVGIYKNMEVTYREFENALLRLGYHKVSKKDKILYVNEVYDSIISINPLNTPDRVMLRGAFSAQAYLMEMKGVLEHRDDIAKMIEQDRLAAQAQNTVAGAAA